MSAESATNRGIEAGCGTGRNVNVQDNRVHVHSFQTTEIFALLGAIAAVAIVGFASNNDSFVVERIWMSVAIIVLAYIVSRGPAKAGSRANHERH